MIELWPWYVMGIGIFALLSFRVTSWWRADKIRVISMSAKIQRRGQGRVASKDIIEERSDACATKRQLPNERITSSSTEWMPIVISLLVLLSALYVILSNTIYQDAQQKWAFGAVGTILGYWFKK